jgi:helix-turn-helix protein
MEDVDDGVGKKLHEARARRKLSFERVEEATKIRRRYLQAIEDEDWDELPGDTYARAFIRTYGSFLGLDGERLAEDQRQSRGSARPGERLPRVDPRPRKVVRHRGQRRRLPPQLVTAVVLALVVGALVAIVLLSGGGSNSPSSRELEATVDNAGRPQKPSRTQPQAAHGHSLKLLAKGEVWVCLLDGAGKSLVDGQILDAGEAAGPFRSGSFTLALGNGAVTMTVDGKQANTPEPSSPIGFAVDRRGKVRELPEGERPTCT